MILRAEQMLQFELVAETGFRRRARDMMKDLWPERCAELSPADLDAKVGRGIETARSYGIAEERQICRFLNIRFMLNREFPDPRIDPWAEPILRDEGLESTGRVNAVWSEINRRYRR